MKIFPKQATINIGVVGHVAHGKSTIVYSITGVQTVKFKNELERNITIKLGYANAKFFKCENFYCPRPGCFKATGALYCDLFCDQCRHCMRLIRHLSFIDCPGHEILMATMLSGTSIMNASLIVIASNEICPQPQTAEHLIAIEIMKIKKSIVVQNKIDLVSKSRAIESYQKIKALVKKTSILNFCVIPFSAQRKCNLDVLIEKIICNFFLLNKNFNAILRVYLIRSFDVNKPGCKVIFTKGGILGGTVLTGVLCINDKIEIRPGIIIKLNKNRIEFFPLKSDIVSLSADKNNLKYVVPGGLIGMGTNIDATFSRNDGLIGHVLGHPKFLPNVYVYVIIKCKLFKRLLGVPNKNYTILPLHLNEILMLNIGSFSTGGKLLSLNTHTICVKFTTPVCCEKFSKVTLSRRINKHWRLIGWGRFIKGRRG